MKKKILFISQEMYPLQSEETPIRLRNGILPLMFQRNGYEPRTFMPKWGEVNERRHQVHEVIRLSGQNIIVNEHDHPILLKVATLRPSRVQVYFIDNEEYFCHRRGVADEQGEYADNDERTIFFCRSVLESLRKFCWEPDIIVCSGWMAALVPLYLRKAYADVPFIQRAKVVLALDNEAFTKPFPTSFADKLLIPGVTLSDVRPIAGFPVEYEALMKIAIEHADGILCSSPEISPRLLAHAELREKPVLPYVETESDILAFCSSL